MTRTAIFALASAAMLLFSPSGVPDAEAQQKRIRVELDQVLLDRWLAIAPGFLKLSRSTQAAPETIDEYFPRWQKMCADAGFETFEQCQDVTGYVGIIIAACDRRTRSFHDPIALMRRQLAALEADTSMAAVEREQKTKEFRETLAVLPERIPREHLRLMTANRDRVFAAILPAAE